MNVYTYHVFCTMQHQDTPCLTLVDGNLGEGTVGDTLRRPVEAVMFRPAPGGRVVGLRGTLVLDPGKVLLSPPAATQS